MDTTSERQQPPGLDPPKNHSCPKCGHLMVVDPGFPTWCDACDWNVTPSQQPPSNRRERRAQQRAGRRAEHLYEEMAKAASEPDRRHEVARLISYGIAGLVHLIAPALIGLAVLIGVSFGLKPWPIIGIVVVVALAWMSRPRFGRVRGGVVLLQRAQAPALYSVVDDISARLGTRRVSLIGIDVRFTASTASIGVRQRRLIVIGLPLWDVLSCEERVGLLAHEVAHDSGGDLLHGTLVRSSLRTLSSWYRLFHVPKVTRGRRSGASISGLTNSGEALAKEILSLLAYLVLVVLRLQAKLARRASPRAEYHADEAASRMASSDSLATLLDKLLLVDRYRAFMATAVRDRDPQIWNTVRSKLDAVPARERERLRRAARLSRQAVDARHPPTSQRIDLLRTRSVARAEVGVSLAIERAIEEEVAQAREPLAQLLMPGELIGAR